MSDPFRVTPFDELYPDHASGVPTAQRLQAAYVDHGQTHVEPRVAEPGEPWAEPVPLDGPSRLLPAFPVDALPGWCGEFVGSLAESTQTPADFGGMFCLAALSAAAADRVVVDVRADWVEPVNIFVVVASPPGTLKSAVVKRVVKPIEDYEELLVGAALPEIVAAATIEKLLETRARDAEAKAAKASPGDREALTEEALSARLAAVNAEVPGRPRVLADDVTPEALGSLLASNRGRLAVFSAEGGVFDTMGGRYARVPNLDPFLKAWSGDTIRVDRSSRPPEYVKDPALTMALAVQPDVLRSIAGQPGFRGRGLLARFLFVMPASTVGYRNVRDPNGVPVRVTNRYEREMRLLCDELYPSETVRRLRLAPDAVELLVGYRERIEPQLREGAELAHIADWVSKLHGQLVRCAALMHLADRPRCDEAISAGTMAKAIRIADYLLAHARVVFDFMGADAELAGARRLLEWLRGQDPCPKRFKRRDAHHANQGTFEKSDDLAPALALLVETRWIRPVPIERSSKPGRRSEFYQVTPWLRPQSTESTERSEEG